MDKMDGAGRLARLSTCRRRRAWCTVDKMDGAGRRRRRRAAHLARAAALSMPKPEAWHGHWPPCRAARRAPVRAIQEPPGPRPAADRARRSLRPCGGRKGRGGRRHGPPRRARIRRGAPARRGTPWRRARWPRPRLDLAAVPSSPSTFWWHITKNIEGAACRGSATLPRRRRACAAQQPCAPERRSLRRPVRRAGRAKEAIANGPPRPPPRTRHPWPPRSAWRGRPSRPTPPPHPSLHPPQREGGGQARRAGAWQGPSSRPSAPVHASESRPKNHARTAHKVQILAFAPPCGQKTPQSGVKCPWRRLSGRYGRCVHHRYILLFGAW